VERVRLLVRIGTERAACHTEYNGFPPPLVPNAVDGLSRVKAHGHGVSGVAATCGKPVGLLRVSPGPPGGVRSLGFTRQQLPMAFPMTPVPQRFAPGRTGEDLGAAGDLKDPKQHAAMQGCVSALHEAAGACQAT
jgi:NAD(P)H-dependent FMN reductase